MNKAQKNSKILNKIKWLWVLPAALMYVVTEPTFGRTMAVTLGIIFGVAFFILCSRGKTIIVCEDIVKDIKDALAVMGHMDSVYEVKSLNFGFVVRVYLIQAKAKTQICNKLINKRIEKGWYKDLIWATQVVDLDSQLEIRTVQRALNQALVADLEEKKQEKREDKKK